MRTKKTKSKTNADEQNLEKYAVETFLSRAGETNTSNATAPETEYVSIASLPTVTSLPAVQELKKSKIEIELAHGSPTTYSSTNMELSTFAGALLSGGLSDVLNTNYGLTPGNKINDLISYYNRLQNYLRNTGSSWFVTSAPTYNNSEFITRKNLNDTLSSKTNYVSIGKDAVFSTKYNTLESTRIVLNIINDIAEAPATDSDKHNRYIFKIFQHTSNTYTCEYSGWFMCYGWTSEKETYVVRSASGEGTGRQDNCKRWAALEGKFKKDNKDYWKILQVQPVLPGNGCNYISFSLPVRSGLELRVVTGFDVGNNSGKFSNVPGSLANHIANAFIGGIYV